MAWYDFAVKAVSKVAEAVPGVIGDYVKSAALKLGLPEEIADLLGKAMDPSKLAGEAAAAAIETVGEKLGIPQDVRDKLGNLAKNPAKLVKAFVEEGPAGLVKEIGGALGIDPKILSAIAVVVNVATQNYAGAAIEATRLAKMAAKDLGLPKSLQNAVNITADIIAKDHEALTKDIGGAALDAAGGLGLSDEATLGLRAGVHAATGDTDAVKKDGIDYAKKKAAAYLPEFVQGDVNAFLDEQAGLPPEERERERVRAQNGRNQQVRA